MLEPEQPTPSGLRRHRFMGRSIELPPELTQAQASSALSRISACAGSRPRANSAANLFECVEAIASVPGRGVCSHWRRGPIREDDSEERLDCGVVFATDG
jgi:hypothetical protein